MKKIVTLLSLSFGILFSPLADAAILGTYKGYMNGVLFVSTQRISEISALANCKLNAKNNPSDAVRCLWNNKEIYNRPAPKPVLGIYQLYVNGILLVTTKNITRANALANCKKNVDNKPQSAIRCLWDKKEILNQKPQSGSVTSSAPTGGSGAPLRVNAGAVNSPQVTTSQTQPASSSSSEVSVGGTANGSHSLVTMNIVAPDTAVKIEGLPQFKLDEVIPLRGSVELMPAKTQLRFEIERQEPSGSWKGENKFVYTDNEALWEKKGQKWEYNFVKFLSANLKSADYHDGKFRIRAVIQVCPQAGCSYNPDSPGYGPTKVIAYSSWHSLFLTVEGKDFDTSPNVLLSPKGGEVLTKGSTLLAKINLSNYTVPINSSIVAMLRSEKSGMHYLVTNSFCDTKNDSSCTKSEVPFMIQNHVPEGAYRIRLDVLDPATSQTTGKDSGNIVTDWSGIVTIKNPEKSQSTQSQSSTEVAEEKDEKTEEVSNPGVDGSLGTHHVYIDGVLSVTTYAISRDEAYAYCTRNSANNPQHTIHCVWNGAELFSRMTVTPGITVTQTTATVPATTNPTTNISTPVVTNQTTIPKTSTVTTATAAGTKVQERCGLFRGGLSEADNMVASPNPVTSIGPSAAACVAYCDASSPQNGDICLLGSTNVKTFVITQPAAKVPCVLSGVSVPDGGSHVFYSDNILGAGQSCTSVDQVRVCTKGVLSGSATYKYATCTVNANLGVYKGYMNGSLFITTSDISKAESLTNCKQNAASNPKATMRCLWNAEVIYTR